MTAIPERHGCVECKCGFESGDNLFSRSRRPRLSLPGRVTRIAKTTRIAYIWVDAEITIEIGDVDHPVVIVTIQTPAGTLELIGAATLSGRTLRIDGVHVQGLTFGTLGRAGLNAIGRKLLKEADVDQIVIQGGARTTGRRRGKAPRPIRFPANSPDPAR